MTGDKGFENETVDPVVAGDAVDVDSRTADFLLNWRERVRNGELTLSPSVSAEELRDEIGEHYRWLDDAKSGAIALAPDLEHNG